MVELQMRQEILRYHVHCLKLVDAEAEHVTGHSLSRTLFLTISQNTLNNPLYTSP